MITEAGKENRLISTEWWTVFFPVLLFLCRENFFHFEEFHVASVQFGCLCSAIVGQVLVLAHGEPEEQTIIVGAMTVVYVLIQMQRIWRIIIEQVLLILVYIT